jgi:hypothetical protein
MRIISQDGKKDFPYEQIAINRYKNKIYIINSNILVGNENLVSDYCLAEYSTEEKALKAMEIFRETYQHTEAAKYYGSVSRAKFIFQFPKDEEIKKDNCTLRQQA